MNFFKKKNILLLTGFVAILFWLLFAFFYEFMTVTIGNRIYNQKMNYEYCLKNSTLEYCQKILDIEDINETEIGSYGYIRDYIVLSLSPRYLIFVYPLVLIIVSSFGICCFFKSGFLTTLSLRRKYKHIILKEILSTYFPAVILSIPFIILIVLCLVFADSPVSKYGPGGVGDILPGVYEMGYTYLIFYLLNIILFSIIICNIVLITARKFKNYFITVLGSYLSFYVMRILGATLSIFYDILDLPGNSLDMEFNCFAPMDVVFDTIYYLVVIGITGVFVFKMYRDKEKMVADCE